MKKIWIVILTLILGLTLIGCGNKKQDDTGEPGSGLKISDIAGYYEIFYMDGDAIPFEDIELYLDTGEMISLTVNEDATALLEMPESEQELVIDLAEMEMTYSGGKISFSYENDVIRLTENGETISFKRADKASGGTSSGTETQTTTPVPGTDEVKFQIEGIDDDLEWNEPTGLNAIILTESGRLSLISYGELAANEGEEIVVATDAVGADIFTYGNGGYRVVLFVRSDGTVSAVDPTEMIINHKIKVKDNLGGLTGVVEIYEQQEFDGTLVVAEMQDGSTEVLDPYF